MAFNYQAIINSINNFAAKYGLTMYAYTPNFKGVIEALDNLQNIQFSVEDGTIVNADVNANAAIAGTKIDPDFGSQTIETTGVFSAADGAAATPSITFTGDTNTGIYRPGADQLAISTNGTQRINIEADGDINIDSGGVFYDATNNRLGIGDSDPNFKLDVNGDVGIREDNNLTFHDGTGTAAFRIRGTSTNKLVFERASGNESQMIIDDGKVGIGTNGPDQKLVVAGNATVGSGSTSGYSHLYFLSGASSSGRYGRISKNYDSPFDLRVTASNSTAAAPICFDTHSGNEVGRFDTLGRLLVGTSSSVSQAGVAGLLQVEATSVSEAAIKVRNNQNSIAGPYVALTKSRGTTIGSNTIVQDEDDLGTIIWFGADGTDAESWAAQIACQVDGTPGANDMPGRLVFSTTADGASSPTERMRIDSSGRVGIGTTSPATSVHIRDSTAVLTLQADDGNACQVLFGDASDVSRGNITYDNSDESLQFKNNNNQERMRIDSSGRVGIGTSSPWTNIEIRGTNVADGVDSRNSATPPSNLFIGVDGFAQNTGGSISFGSDRDSASDYCAYGAIAARRDSALSYVYSGYLTFSTSGGSTLNERMRISSSGNVGIGTTSPGYLIDASNSSAPTLRLTDGIRPLLVRGGSTTQNPGIGTDYAGDLSFFTNGTTNERARIDSSGRLLVGTSSTGIDATLQVNGSIAWADNNGSNYTQPSIGGLANGSTTTFDIAIPSGTHAFQVTLAASANGGDRIGGVVANLYTSSYGATIRRSLQTITNNQWSFSSSSLSGSTLTITVTNSSGYTGYIGQVRIIQLA